MIKYLKLFKRFTILHLKSGMEYKKAFILQVTGMLINNSAFIFFWLVIYAKFKNSFIQSNIDFKQVMLIWAIASSGFGITHVFFGGTRILSQLIFKGVLDIYLTYPKNPLIILSMSRTNISAWGDIIYGYIIFLIFVSTNLLSIFIFTFYIIVSAIALGSIFVIFHSLTFFLGNAEKFANSMNESVIMFGTYPENIFSPFVKFMLFTILPVGFYVYLPVKLILHFNPITFILMIIGDIILLGLAFFMFFIGIKKYESGNIFYSNK